MQPDKSVDPTPPQPLLHTVQVLTPAEFVAAGDYLVSTCPTWSWEAGDSKKSRSYLPPNKQFLITRNGGCRCLWSAANACTRLPLFSAKPLPSGPGGSTSLRWMPITPLHVC